MTKGAAPLVTVTVVGRCGWCGDPIEGRRRVYCRPSHRQRHYEARRRARGRRLGPDEELHSATAIRHVRDAILNLTWDLKALDEDPPLTISDHQAALEALTHAIKALAALPLTPHAIGNTSTTPEQTAQPEHQ